MHKVIVNRSFAHRAFGDIATVNLNAEASIILNGKEVPAAGVEYLLNFALQSLQDAYAGAKSGDEARGNFEKKLERVLDGTIGLRGGSGGVSEEQKIARSILRAGLRQNSEAWAKFKELSDAEQNAKLDELAEKNAEALAKPIAEEVKRREAERKAKAAAVAAIDFTI